MPGPLPCTQASPCGGGQLEARQAVGTLGCLLPELPTMPQSVCVCAYEAVRCGKGCCTCILHQLQGVHYVSCRATFPNALLLHTKQAHCPGPGRPFCPFCCGHQLQTSLILSLILPPCSSSSFMTATAPPSPPNLTRPMQACCGCACTCAYVCVSQA